MKTAFELNAEFRDAEGKGASRRLRRANKVPAILYGGHREPRALALDHTKLMLMLDNERFYSTIIGLKVGNVMQAAILKDVQRHPAKNAVLHVDPGVPMTIGERVTVGHQVMLHGCTIGDGSLVGIQAIVLNHVVIGEECLVAAGAILTEGKTFPPRSLIMGAPAKAVRELSDQHLAMVRHAAKTYIERRGYYITELTRVD